MTLSCEQVEELRKWARRYAPEMRPMTVGDLERGDMAVLHRPVRLEIAAELLL